MPIWERRIWKTNRSADEILKIVLDNLTQKKATVIEATPSRIDATMGSRMKTRLYGGLLASDDKLPVKMTLYLYRDEHAREKQQWMRQFKIPCDLALGQELWANIVITCRDCLRN